MENSTTSLDLEVVDLEVITERLAIELVADRAGTNKAGFTFEERKEWFNTLQSDTRYHAIEKAKIVLANVLNMNSDGCVVMKKKGG